MNNYDLAISLAKAEKEEKVIEILKTAGYWDSPTHWRPYGDNENNYSTIGNQQSKANSALVEKIINSVDAILTKECLIRGIDILSKDAPQSIDAALRMFFGIREGKISYLDVKQRKEMANDIILAATGLKTKPNLTLVDKGEGQTPEKLPQTILSISKSNKLKVQFVQGKYNMGGTGALPFCGENNFQLIISKRCPYINEPNMSQKWSVTLVRRERPYGGRKSSMFTYLVDKDGDILNFETESLPIIPLTKNQGYEDMYYGTYLKLYNYQLVRSEKTNILFDLNYRLALMIPELAHPVRLRECRNYKGHYFETTLSGLRTRLIDAKDDCLENGFPSSHTFRIDDQPFKCTIYVFKEGKAKTYRQREGLLYVINGQTHATARDSFFNRVNLSYLAESLLVIIDCSEVSTVYQEDMFMNSRDRLRSSGFSKKAESYIEDMLLNHPQLKELNYQRRSEKVKSRLANDQPLVNVLENIITKSPVLTKVLLNGNRIKNPFNLEYNSGDVEVFEGKRHPTYFYPVKKTNHGILHKNVAINRDFQIKYATDVENNYFSRPDEQGELFLDLNGVPSSYLIKSLGLFNGIATLNIRLPEDVKVGQIIDFQTYLSNEYIANDFRCKIQINVTEAEEKQSGGAGKRTPPSGKNGKNNRKSPSHLNLPTVIEVYREDWEDYSMDGNSSICLMPCDTGSDYYINMDNDYLLAELKNMKEVNDIKLANARYKYSMVLFGLSVESYCKSYNEKNNNDIHLDVKQEVEKFTKMISPVILPTIEAMVDLHEDTPKDR